ncbi:MAG TPA: tetratricopeptide repeat protein [Gemmatimonas sp.]|nr:tetratricopeptide repeat protein [Gemmatimonas sp.]
MKFLPVSRAARLVPLTALFAVGGCFATRSDVRVVQTDVASLRLEMVRNDAQIRADIQAVTALVNAASDSLGRLSARTVSVQGDVRGESRAIKEQLLQIQSLLGQSDQTLKRLRADLEARNNQQQQMAQPVGVPPAAGAPGSAVPPTAVAPLADSSGPGPAALYTNGRDQLSRGSNGTARMLFQKLLLDYPTSDLAPEAQISIADSYLKEKNYPAAESAYAAVVTSYPTHPKAATALYKRGTVFELQNNLPEARKFWSEVIARYPRSDEAGLAAERLKARL